MKKRNEKRFPRPATTPTIVEDATLEDVSGGRQHPVYPMPPGQFPGEGNGWLPGHDK